MPAAHYYKIYNVLAKQFYKQQVLFNFKNLNIK